MSIIFPRPTIAVGECIAMSNGIPITARSISSLIVASLHHADRNADGLAAFRALPSSV